MPEDEEGSLIQDKATLKHVATCDGWGEVQTILNEYRETAFTDLVYMIRFCAKLQPTETCYNRMDPIILEHLRHYHYSTKSYEHPLQLTERIL